MSGPLAHQLRPRTLNEFIGQTKSVGVNSIIHFFLKSKRLNNLILWGPPGSGKTSLAYLLGSEFGTDFVSLNAVEIGAKILREIGEAARMKFRLEDRQTIVFIDEIHRLNKSQQDILLPFMEQGDFVLIGATTENPSYELNRAVLSRSHLLVFEQLTKKDLIEVWHRCCTFLKLEPHWVESEALNYLIHESDGDARRFINLIELLALYREQNLSAFDNSSMLDLGSSSPPIGSSAVADLGGEEESSKNPTLSKNPTPKSLSLEEVREILPKQLLAYDKNGDSHYDIISAFIKSIRGSDPDAGLYYLARMIESGEDPLFIARRLVILASEDIGNADPRALQVAVAGAEAVRLVGLPEGAINLAQVVTYLASAPKSNRSYKGWLKAKEFVQGTKSVPIPHHLRSSQTTPMKNLGYGKGYLYPHDEPKAWVDQNYLPESLRREVFYEPSERGFEKNIKEYSQWLKTKLPEDFK